MLLDRQSVLPLYYQIRQKLLEQIRCGALRAGDPLPSEQDIAARLRVSRMTARQAIKSLCEMGLVYSQRGKGTFVSHGKLEKNSRQVLSFSEEMRARGTRPLSKVLEFAHIRPSREVAEALGLGDGDEIYRLRRVRLADAVPLCIETTHLPARLCPELTKTLAPGGSLYQGLWEAYGIQIDWADEIAESSLANAAEAKLLRIRPKSPVFRFTRTAYLLSGQPVEYVRSVYRGDRCKVVSRLSRQAMPSVSKA
ncbi:MAG TPA: GntR family transcriptional regulator [Candidatus Acidoferrales bacterium]|nr:GntR family transcriptional regulator [Candidatus Acidoferrales bacterium]